jgi:aminopeptidase N
MKHLNSVAIVLSLSFAASGDTYPRQPSVHAIHYLFRLTLNDASDEIVGETTADIRFLSDGVTEFWLDLASASNGKGMTVSEVTSGGAAVRYGHKADRLLITLPTPAKSGERRQFTVKYRGIPASGLWASANSYGDRGIFSVNWPNLAHQWLPIIDHPYDKATSEFVIIAPAKYQVAANGLLQEERDLGDGMRMTHWKQSVPIASWLNAIAVAQFSKRQIGSAAGVELSTWVPYQEREAGMKTFDLAARQAMEFFSENVGPFPYEKLANVWASAPGFRGGTEHASVIFYGCCQSSSSVVWHEIAHQWFGDSVTEKDWDDVWLSEGFATYFTLLASEHYQGRDAFVKGLTSSRNRVFELEKRLPAATVEHNNLSDMSKVLNQLIYQKGGWTLHMLRAQVGTDKFWEGIREYYRLYRDSNASTEDLRKVMEEISGQDLRWFFQQWLYRTPSPAVEGVWTYNAANKRIEIEIAQTQKGMAYRLPLEIGVAEGIVRIEMTEKQQHFEIPVEREPAVVTLDPNTWVLMEARFGKR